MTTTPEQPEPGAHATQGRLVARPAHVTAGAPLGLRQLGIVGQRDVLLYVPPQYRPGQPAPLAVMLHGAGGDAAGSLRLLQAFADERGLILVGPASRGPTWDLLLDDYGPDIAVIDRALAQVFQAYAVDPQRLAIGGFSDGASYALSVGVTNGDLFSHVIAFSPGFMAPASQQGAPRLFISHGIHDNVLPIERCSRRIVPQVQRAGYDVRYREFDGPHTVPPSIAREAVDWYLQEPVKE
ncbi:MAG TPA: PHB depolymerase family esterase [Herpetosiphonaceae bacterium]